MRHAEGEKLSSMMEEYSRLNHEFEYQNGYAYQSEIIGVLKGLGFTEDDFSKKCSALSGGQKTRVSLGKLLLTKPDLILLDEPTNHLDMNSIIWLEDYLRGYAGSVILVAHDRYFLGSYRHEGDRGGGRAYYDVQRELFCLCGEKTDAP